MFSVYILKSKVDGSFYIGQTNDINDRLIRHNSGRAKYTKNKVPWDLVYSEKFDSRSKALQREKEIKSWKSSKLINKLIEHSD